MRYLPIIIAMLTSAELQAFELSPRLMAAKGIVETCWVDQYSGEFVIKASSGKIYRLGSPKQARAKHSPAAVCHFDAPISFQHHENPFVKPYRPRLQSGVTSSIHIRAPNA